MRRAHPSRFERIPTAARAWASRLVLLLACASVVATSRAQSEDVLSPTLTGTPVRLTTDTGKVTRTVVVRATAKEDSKDPVEGELRIQARAKWTPSDPTQTAQPWLAIHHSEGEFATGSGSGVLEPGVTVTVESSASLGHACPLNQDCEWTVQVAFEVQSNTGPGTVDVEWTAQAAAHVLDDSSVPKGFTVSLSEP
ncbi:hypothetical protein [Corallococcus carmarthensis]|uniref:hypothetical protein n=1 Tax=Corallococcus carmarthensis TaxID=2316728 RepID=UPI00148D1F16|nr:hypothetical protein [Corallococcus carmarthensis]NOK16478.1 hypothetical protein [Corallococcus carmarthensis]